ncbi:hypothetical protein KR044_003461 [Drosophila immigrans]|nr:hypothetical protein KR044_003461 [Drosophila immigrans]
MSVVIETTLGDLTVDLFTDERPIACLNFIKLCQLKYYNFNLFHTVQQGFIAQTGDPNGSGNGGSSIWGVVEGSHKRFFEAEYIPKIHHSGAGLLSFVSAGNNLVGSQFFFTLGENLTSLDGTHCVIGEVVEGHELLRKLNDAIVDENFRPYQDIRITHTVVLEDPFPNPRGFQVPTRSPSLSAERLKNGRIAADENIDDTNGKTMEEIQELLAEREAKARATILEIVGDLPDAEMAPPENVLFVCKLNPVTTDDDLEIIFSRFGVVKGCEVIRDRKTGDSLQYAFVEFDNQQSCEAAYFKMDNVLIDDRRIHVDFSQSVSKVTWRGKGRGVVGSCGKLDFNNLGNTNRNAHRNRIMADGPKKAQYDQHNQRSRMSSTERKKVRELRHKEQKCQEDSRRSRDDNGRRKKGLYRRRSRSRDRPDQRRSRSKDQYRSRSKNRPSHRRSRSRDTRSTQYRSRSRERYPQRRSRSRDVHNKKRSRSHEPRNNRKNVSSVHRSKNYSPERRSHLLQLYTFRLARKKKENINCDDKGKGKEYKERSESLRIERNQCKHAKISESFNVSEQSSSHASSSDDSSKASTSSSPDPRKREKKHKKSKAKKKHKSKRKQQK